MGSGSAKGVDAAKWHGAYKGRKKGTVEPAEKFLAKYPGVVCKLRSTDMSLRDVAAVCGVSVGTKESNFSAK